jgi:hypothetical protein
MTEQELRAWSLAIAAIENQGKKLDLDKLIERSDPISEYIKKGKPLTPEELEKRSHLFKM